MRERASAGFSAAERGDVERRAAGLTGEASDAVRVGGDVPSCGYEKLPEHDVRDAGGSAWTIRGDSLPRCVRQIWRAGLLDSLNARVGRGAGLGAYIWRNDGAGG